ncbi:UNVERIFIED_CONTAM: hypothetical protein NCL1_58793 [Trichonephila clavipes]
MALPGSPSATRVSPRSVAVTPTAIPATPPAARRCWSRVSWRCWRGGSRWTCWRWTSPTCPRRASIRRWSCGAATCRWTRSRSPAAASATSC